MFQWVFIVILANMAVGVWCAVRSSPCDRDVMSIAASVYLGAFAGMGFAFMELIVIAMIYASIHGI